MTRHGLAVALALALAQPSLAATGDAGAEEDAAETLFWTVSLDGGTSITEGSAEQWSAGAEIALSFGDGRVSLGYARSRDDGAPGVLGSRTDQFTLAGGYGFGALGIDAYASYGKRKFDAKRFRRRNGQDVTITGKG